MPRYRINKGSDKKKRPLKSTEKEYMGKICCKICGKLREQHKEDEHCTPFLKPKLVRSISGDRMITEKDKKYILKKLAQQTPRTAERQRKRTERIFEKISGEKHIPSSVRLDVYEAAIKANEEAKSDKEFLELFEKLYVRHKFHFSKGFLNKKPKKKSQGLKKGFLNPSKRRTPKRVTKKKSSGFKKGFLNPSKRRTPKRIQKRIAKAFYESASEKALEHVMRRRYPHQCCPGATKFVKSHGVMRADPFRVPKGVNIITLTTVSITCPFVQKLDRQFEILYDNGHTLFKNKDKSKQLTEIGQTLENKLNSQFLPDYEQNLISIVRKLKLRNPRETVNQWVREIDAPTREGARRNMLKLYAKLRLLFPQHNIRPPQKRFKIKNHIPGEWANNQILTFYGLGCNRNSCSIDCFYKPGKWRKSCPMKGYKKAIKAIMLNAVVHKEGPGTYIIFACRSFRDYERPAAIKMMRQISR